MQLKFFDIPVHQAEEAGEDLNRFLRAHRIINIERHFVSAGANSSWAICVSYVEGGVRPASTKRSKIDYRDVLSEPDFALFSRLRELRKRLAAEEGVPVYALFTNEQLAEMVQKRASSLSDLAAIDGVGKARIDRHGQAFLSLIREASGSPNQPQVNGNLHEA